MALKKHGKARRKWLECAGHKADNEDLEEAVFEWIIDMHSGNLPVSLRMIQAKVKAFSTKDDFQASRERTGIQLSVSLIITQVEFTVPLSNLPCLLVIYITNLHRV